MTRYVFVFLFLTCSCATAHYNFAKHPPQNKQDCMNLFTNINNIQAQRKAGMHKMDRHTDMFKSGNISKKAFHEKRTTWLEEENELRTYVNTLYDIGYAHHCF